MESAHGRYESHPLARPRYRAADGLHPVDGFDLLHGDLSMIRVLEVSKSGVICFSPETPAFLNWLRSQEARLPASSSYPRCEKRRVASGAATTARISAPPNIFPHQALPGKPTPRSTRDRQAFRRSAV